MNERLIVYRDESTSSEAQGGRVAVGRPLCKGGTVKIPRRVQRAIDHYLGGAEHIGCGVVLHGHTLWFGGYPIAYLHQRGRVVAADVTLLPTEIAPIGEYVQQVAEAQGA